MELLLHAFLTSALNKFLWPASPSSHFIPKDNPRNALNIYIYIYIYIYIFWARDRPSLPLPGIDPQFLGRPARSYYTALRYNESYCNRNKTKAKSMTMTIVLTMMTMILVKIMKFNFMYTTHQTIL